MSNPTPSPPNEHAAVSFEMWCAEVDKALKGADFNKRLVTRTLEGIDVQPLYTARDLPIDQDAAGFAGGSPYRRGSQAVGRHGEGRDLRPRFDNPDSALLRAEIADDLARGANSLWLFCDAGVRAGQASAELALGASLFGVPCLSAAQFGEILVDVPLDRVAVSLDAGSNALAVTACLVEAARTRGIGSERLRGFMNADPLGALARDGALPFTLDSARMQATELARWAAAHAPGIRALTASAVPYHDAGAHAAQELAYALATGVGYLRWLSDAGLSLSAASSQLAFSFSVGSDFFMEIAKLRAMRQCWASVIHACGGTAEDQQCVLHVTTSTRTKTTRDPWVNLLRETTEAFAAAVAGADSITTGGFDRLLGPSTSFARRIARNTQVILDEEAHVSQVADPAGGAFYVEALTDALATRAWELFQAIEADGGMAAALQSGSIARQVEQASLARDVQLAKRKQVITGVSEFASVDEQPVPRPTSDFRVIADQRRAALDAASKDEGATRALLQARADGRGMVEAAIEAAGRGADLGRLSCALAGPGAPARIAALPLRRHAREFERLRDTCDASAKSTGRRPSAFLCNLGTIPEHKARAQFATGFFNAGGLAVIDNDGFSSPESAAQAFERSGAALAILCGSDDAYQDAVARYAPLLVARGAKRVLLAGRPGEAEGRYRNAGVSDFIFVGCDVVQILADLLAATGVQS
jgi:methylmalonyl-CoA mutase